MLAVMAAHTGIHGSGTGRVCVCGEVYFTAIEHTMHVAEEIAAAYAAHRRREKAQERANAVARAGRGDRVVRAGQLDRTHIGRTITAPHPNGDVHGVLLDIGTLPSTSAYLEVWVDPGYSRNIAVRPDDAVTVHGQ